MTATSSDVQAIDFGSELDDAEGIPLTQGGQTSARGGGGQRRTGNGGGVKHVHVAVLLLVTVCLSVAATYWFIAGSASADHSLPSSAVHLSCPSLPPGAGAGLCPECPSSTNAATETTITVPPTPATTDTPDTLTPTTSTTSSTSSIDPFYAIPSYVYSLPDVAPLIDPTDPLNILLLSLADDKKNIVFTSYTGEGYIPWIRNFLFWVTSHSLQKHTLIVGMEQKDCTWINDEQDKITNNPAARWHCWVDTSEYTKQLLAKNQAIPMGAVVVVKFYYAYRCVLLGLNPIFLDGDVILIKNPISLVDSHYDMQGLSDLDKDVIYRDNVLPNTCPLYGNIGYKPCQSTGVIYYQATYATWNFLRQMTSHLLANPGEWEQYAYQIQLPPFFMGGSIIKHDYTNTAADAPIDSKADAAAAAQGGTTSFLSSFVSRPPLRYRLFPDIFVANCRMLGLNQGTLGWTVTSELLHILHVGYVHGHNKLSAYKELDLFHDLSLQQIADIDFSTYTQHIQAYKTNTKPYTCSSDNN